MNFNLTQERKSAEAAKWKTNFQESYTSVKTFRQHSIQL